MTETATCEKCGMEYERYTILYTDDFNTIAAHKELRQRYNNLCQSCFNEEMSAGGYAITGP